MKAIYVSKGPLQNLTVGKTYEVLQGADGRWAAIDDDGDVEYWILEERFSPVPDPVPEPVNEWMQVNERVYVNMVTKVVLEFSQYSRSKICVVSIGENNHWEAINQYAEAFAQMVGYKWEE